MRIPLLSAIALLLISAMNSVGQAPPLVDGNCSEYPPLKAERISVSKDVDLHIYQDRHFVWLCYTYPDGSFATADLKLTAPALTFQINLHVSANSVNGRPEDRSSSRRTRRAISGGTQRVGRRIRFG